MRIVGEIILTENSTASNPPKIFHAQTIDIIHVPDTALKNGDGYTAIAYHPSTIFWLGGTVKQLEKITNVKIVSEDGVVMVDGELNTYNGVPQEVGNGVRFFVLND